MSILNVEHLTHGFGDRAIFNDVSFRLLKGEHIGLIGANGEGKSTFMNIITGKLMPDEGKVEWAKNVRVGYLDQHTVLTAGQTIRDVLSSAFDFLFAMETEMNEICDKMGDATPEELEVYMEELGTIQDLLTMHDFYMIDSKVEEVGRALGLLDIGLDRDVTELSGGQRTKVLLGKLLLEKPDILLLDEPTNYLDAEHIEWLKRYLNEYENAFILISHDIPFLNSVINLIYHMDNQELNRYVGDYDKFQEVYAMKKAQLEAAYNRQQKEIADLKDFVARNKARVSTRNMAMSRQKKLDKMDVIELAAEKPKPEFNFREARTSGKILFETKDLVIGYDEPLSSPLNISMERGQKVVLTGANGIGKTTLLKSILGLIPPVSGQVSQGDYLEIGYFEQEMRGSGDNSCLEEIWQEFPGFTQYEVRSALAKCGLTTKHIESRVKVLSGGEQAKVRLCKLINRGTNILLLDEPTNHLDVDAKAELKRALQSYKGSILMVCHEPEFYEDLATDVWDCTKWTTRVI
ncbi:MAG: ABC-F family ATP-binding cassette domain-containing protein [Lachnospiraceae bacterium]|nr:ABC-F family ATP-binding cassette domain-containing protein [Lachnospiraceae bacterium]